MLPVEEKFQILGNVLQESIDTLTLINKNDRTIEKANVRICLEFLSGTIIMV